MLGVVVQIDGFDPVAAAPVTLRAASHDDPAVCHLDGQTWWPTLRKLPTLRYDLFDGAFGGAITAPSSSLTLSAEPWPNFGRYALADARLRLWTGDVGQPWAGWVLRFDGRISEQPELEEGAAPVSFAVDDRWLDAALFETYAGTTGAEGSAELKGQPKPLALGRPRYVAGTLVDPVNSVFQISGHGAVQSIEGCLEKLARFGAPVADYPNYAALVAANVPAGRWATANAVGMARLGAPPTGQISFLVSGDAAGPDGWARRPGQLVRRLALLSGGAGRIHEASLNALDVARPYNLSIYLDQQTTARQVIQQLAASINAVAGMTWTGQLFVVPVAIGASALILAADGSALPPVGTVKQIGIASPFKKLAIGAERAWTVHALADIAFTATLVDMGAYVAGATYREGNLVQSDGSTWLYINPAATSGNAPPTLPIEEDAYWRVLARAGTDGQDGRDGINGTDGAPGGPGANGLTSYVHTAFADSLDGTVNFTTGLPQGRGFRGEYSDFTAADSSDPAAYVWSEYRGPTAFGLAITGPGYLRGNMAVKTGSAIAYDFGVYSTEGWRGGCQATFRSTNHFGDAHAGLNGDPTSDTDFASIDYAWRLIGGALGTNQCVATMNGVDTPFVGGAWSTDTTFQVIYDNRRVRWLKDGGEVYSVAAPSGLLLYFDAVLHQPNVGVKDIAFGAAGAAGADGTDGLNGTDGAPGAPGTDGLTSYVHTAFADSLDGTVNFTTGSPQGRSFRGEYSDFTAADSGDPAAYVWSEYRGPASFGLAITGPGYLRGNMAVKTGPANAYDFQAYSTEGWRGGCQATFRATNHFGDAYAGLNTDPTTDTDPGSIDYAWRLIGGALGSNQCVATINAADTLSVGGAWNTDTTFQVIYDNRRVRWLKDGAEVHSVGAAAGALFYFDSGFRQSNVGVKDIAFGAAGAAGADGTNGLNGTDGINGAPGANGQTSYTHLAYADSADGSVNFTNGAAAGRSYIGIYQDFSAPDSGNYLAYAWSRWRGSDGENGVPGAPGANGQTPYTHFAWSTAPDGSTGFSVSDPSGRTYLGVYTDFVEADSANPALYTWSLIKGADGAPGAPGPAGRDAIVFQQDTTPASPVIGDTWVTATPPRLWRKWNGTQWVQILGDVSSLDIIDEAYIADLTVGTAKIKDLAVGTLKIANQAVSDGILAVLPNASQYIAQSGSFVAYFWYTDRVYFATTGGRVRVDIQLTTSSDVPGSTGMFAVLMRTDGAGNEYTVGRQFFARVGDTPLNWFVVDSPGAGTISYRVRFYQVSNVSYSHTLTAHAPEISVTEFKK